MMGMNENIREILGLKDQAADAWKKAESISLQVEKKTRELRRRIKRGESTGDKIRDFVVMRYGPNEELETRIRNLEGHISQHVGEFVLMVVKHVGLSYQDEPYSYTNKLRVHTEEYLGVLKGGALLLSPNGDSHALPTDSYLENWRGIHNPVLVKENLQPPRHTFYQDDMLRYLDQPLEQTFVRREEPDICIELVIGDGAIKKWRKYTDPATLERAARLLGRQTAAVAPA